MPDQKMCLVKQQELEIEKKVSYTTTKVVCPAFGNPALTSSF